MQGNDSSMPAGEINRPGYLSPERRGVMYGSTHRPGARMDLLRHADVMDDEVAALRAERDEAREENTRWKATYNDLVGRVPSHLLDQINRGAAPHAHEFPNERAEKAEAEVERMRPVVEAAKRVASHYLTLSGLDPIEEALEHAVDAYRVAQQEACDHDWRESGPNGWEKCASCGVRGKDSDPIG